MKKNNSAIGSNWNDVRKELFTPEEIAESDLRVSIISEIINARNEKGISQKQLELMSGVKQPVIARLEKGQTNPQLDTILKLLVPLGKKLIIVDDKQLNKTALRIERRYLNEKVIIIIISCNNHYKHIMCKLFCI